MSNLSNLSITIRPCVLMSSAIIGFARVVVDQKILLKEIPISQNEGNLSVVMSSCPVAICAAELDMDILNQVIYGRRQTIEQAVLDEIRKNGTG